MHRVARDVMVAKNKCLFGGVAMSSTIDTTSTQHVTNKKNSARSWESGTSTPIPWTSLGKPVLNR
jgi:hypothetical protein